MSMTESDRRIIGQCLRAAADGPFFEDWEFQTLFGLERDEVRRVAMDWPNIADADGDAVTDLAVNNSFANLLGYPHGQSDALAVFVSVDEADMERVFDHWRAHLNAREMAARDDLWWTAP